MQELNFFEIEAVSGGEKSAAYEMGNNIGKALRWAWDNIPRFPAPNTDHYVS
ncbi:hypothetical protein [Massilia sp. DD77]|uniref:hypothetical protein n=1 Tax=Massilia sp. DD77 TaxID=3109349 RepID=UPI00300030B3